ncbi:MAG TPA: hypothetical protein VMU86_01105 [Steroidobacteraceae bacterium]|nr:hypothetical protein [Steroidobacteraceae bacterium]
MGIKYYTHFLAQSDGAAEHREYRGIVELLGRLESERGDQEIARVLARSFDLEESDIRILQWQRLH